MPSTHTLTFHEVGGCVRDDLLGVESNDVDFTVTGVDSFAEMVERLDALGFKRFVTSEETLTVRAKVPNSMPELLARTQVADFVLARRESSESTGRRPDVVEVGTLEDDLARRDFTVNAMARATDGTLVDPHGGQADLAAMTLRFVGNPMDRVREDALRVVRAVRFAFTKGFTMAPETEAVVKSAEALELLRAVKLNGKRVVSVERLQTEVQKMLEHDVWGTLQTLQGLGELGEALLADGALAVKVTAKVVPS